MNYLPMVPAEVVPDASGWKVNFTPNPDYQFYTFKLAGQRSVTFYISQDWAQSGGVTSYTKPTQISSFGPFKKSHAGTVSTMRFYGINTATPVAKAMLESDFSSIAILPDNSKLTTTTNSGANLLFQYCWVDDSL
jgi:hypothetical protein